MRVYLARATSGVAEIPLIVSLMYGSILSTMRPSASLIMSLILSMALITMAAEIPCMAMPPDDVAISTPH
ncbi:hypothetical protein D3C81_2201950 [compost metagenome]